MATRWSHHAGKRHLGDGNGVQCGGELAVAASGEAVSSLGGTGYLDGRRSGVVGERGRGREPGRPTGSPDQTTCGHRADADGAGQGAPEAAMSSLICFALALSKESTERI